MRGVLHLSVVLLALTAVLPSLSAAPAYTCTRWTSEEGLPSNTVLALAQTPDGYVWIGTEAGLVRFDGSRFTDVRLPGLSDGASTMVRTLAPSRRRGLWIGTASGIIFHYDGFQCRRITAVRRVSPTAPLPVLEDGNGTLWIGTGDAGLAIYARARLRYVGPEHGLPHPFVTSLCPGDGGGVWAGTEAGMALVVEGRVARVVERPQGLGDRRVTALARDARGATWIGTRSGHLYRLANGRV